MKRGLVNGVKYVSATTALVVLIGCGAVQRPTSYTYPTNEGASYSQVENDRRDCAEWARIQGAGARGEGVEKGVQGGALGALIGGVIGYAIGRDTKAAAIGAGIGAGAGGTAGVIHGSELSQEDFNRAYNACMKAKGYVTE